MVHPCFEANFKIVRSRYNLFPFSSPSWKWNGLILLSLTAVGCPSLSILKFLQLKCFGLFLMEMHQTSERFGQKTCCFGGWAMFCSLNVNYLNRRSKRCKNQLMLQIRSCNFILLKEELLSIWANYWMLTAYLLLALHQF